MKKTDWKTKNTHCMIAWNTKNNNSMIVKATKIIDWTMETNTWMIVKITDWIMETTNWMIVKGMKKTG
jgi:hypothetical protein